ADAAIDDGRLDLHSLPPMPLRRLLPLALAMRRGVAHRREEVDAAAGRVVRVTTSRPLRVSADGELCTRTPATFEVCPKALQVLAAEPAS
ncbi:MAG: lipid kinase, partial [Myxococcota bacterium]|nr:lipid kinase [Myxococcota bacterium]